MPDYTEVSLLSKHLGISQKSFCYRFPSIIPSRLGEYPSCAFNSFKFVEGLEFFGSDYLGKCFFFTEENVSSAIVGWFYKCHQVKLFDKYSLKPLINLIIFQLLEL